MAPSILPAPRVGTELESQLATLVDERMLDPARRTGIELALLGATILPQRQVICRSKNGTWLLVDQREDPTAKDYEGRIPIPEAQHARLTKLADAGVSPDHVWLGHELPPGWEEGDEIEQLVPPPAHLRKRDELLLRCVRTIVDFGLAASGAALAAPLALGSAVAGLDPVILGGVEHPDEPIVGWVALAHWHWD